MNQKSKAPPPRKAKPDAGKEDRVASMSAVVPLTEAAQDRALRKITSDILNALKRPDVIPSDIIMKGLRDAMKLKG